MIIASVLFSTHLFTAVLSSVLLLGEKAVKSGNNAMKTKADNAMLNSLMIYEEEPAVRAVYQMGDLLVPNGWIIVKKLKSCCK